MAANRLDEALARIRKDPSGSDDFLICDAKDGDMGGGVVYPGPRLGPDGRPTGRLKSRAEHLDQVRALVRQGVVDLVLLSVANLELLIREGLFEGTSVATAVRANDTTDIWGPRHSRYKGQPSRPFRTAPVPHMMHGRLDAERGAPAALTDLGLYSVTFTDDAERDARALEEYQAFRLEAEAWGFRHFLEVFNPNVGAESWGHEEVGAYVNDCLTRCLAGVPDAARPRFLKIVYNGPRALEELAAFDPTLVVGILGGGAGTTRDTFELLHAARRHGARLVLFGRKINLAEDPLGLVALMRRVADREVGPQEAVRAYHDGLRRAGLAPRRALEEDAEISEAVLRA